MSNIIIYSSNKFYLFWLWSTSSSQIGSQLVCSNVPSVTGNHYFMSALSRDNIWIANNWTNWVAINSSTKDTRDCYTRQCHAMRMPIGYFSLHLTRTLGGWPKWNNPIKNWQSVLPRCHLGHIFVFILLNPFKSDIAHGLGWLPFEDFEKWWYKMQNPMLSPRQHILEPIVFHAIWEMAAYCVKSLNPKVMKFLLRNL